jgi:hypothetical protein
MCRRRPRAVSPLAGARHNTTNSHITLYPQPHLFFSFPSHIYNTYPLSLATTIIHNIFHLSQLISSQLTYIHLLQSLTSSIHTTFLFFNTSHFPPQNPCKFPKYQLHYPHRTVHFRASLQLRPCRSSRPRVGVR